MQKNRIVIIIFLLAACFQINGQICPGTPGQILWECWQGLYDDELSELTAAPHYPNHPDVIQTKYRIQGPINYDNYMGSRMRGFLSVPVSDTVVFNVTGNEMVHFFLSTDMDPTNKILQAYTDDDTGSEEHTKYASQTSDSIFLEAGFEYYFEVLHVDGSSSDHSAVWWKTDLVDPVAWNIITASFIRGVDCLGTACLPEGTPCDDGNAMTINDEQDGNCNCLGSPVTSNGCVGVRGQIQNYHYDTIPGSDLNDLYMHPNFPAMPSYSEVLPLLGRPSISEVNDEGDLVQGYLTVPVTGSYKFNVTGDDETILFISSDDDPANKQAHQAFVSGWTYMTQHDKYIWQSTSFITLTAGQYYYIEMNHKEGGGSEHFAAFWQTPFTEAGVWKRIPPNYFHDYDCEVSCIPEFTLCDDGDPFTNDDMYDANCDCVGTPCSGPDCDSPLANYVPYDKCSVTDQINNLPSNNWLSCHPSENPNTARDRSHWIQYDLGVKHELYQTQVWNYNVTNITDQGFETVAIDFSTDGSTWTEYGIYNWPLATGDSNYSGFNGPDFMGTEAQFILITSLDDTTTCRGLGKIAFTAIKCPDAGYACDDGDPNTTDDQYNNNCECVGVNFLDNRCEDQILVLGDTTLMTNNFSAIDYVHSISTIDEAEKVSFIGGNSVELNTGFVTGPNTTFIAAIDTCEVITLTSEELSMGRKSALTERQQQMVIDKLKGLQVISEEGSDIQTIKFFIDKPSDVKIELVNQKQEVAYTLINHKYRNQGVYSKRLRTKKMDPGIYTVMLTTEHMSEMEKMIVL